MNYQIKTEVYEGPFDLLVSLVNRRQVNVMEISLTGIVNDYLEYLDQLREMDIEATSEFLLLAGTLIALKARLLLPDTFEEADDYFDLIEERDQLLARLLASLTFKDVAALFAHRMESAARKLPRSEGIDRPLTIGPPPLPSVPLAELAQLAARVLSPAEEPQISMGHLDLEAPSLEDTLSDLRTRMKKVAESSFERLVEHCTRRVEVVTYFLAMLELARLGLISIDQPDRFTDITVRQAKREPVV